MKTIWKYELEPGVNTINAPKGATPLDVQSQNGTPVLWMLVNPEEEVKLDFRVGIYGTGHTIWKYPGSYIGTFQLQSGMLVFHAFIEEGELSNESQAG